MKRKRAASPTPAVSQRSPTSPTTQRMCLSDKCLRRTLRDSRPAPPLLEWSLSLRLPFRFQSSSSKTSWLRTRTCHRPTDLPQASTRSSQTSPSTLNLSRAPLAFNSRQRCKGRRLQSGQSRHPSVSCLTNRWISTAVRCSSSPLWTAWPTTTLAISSNSWGSSKIKSASISSWLVRKTLK